VPLPKGIVTPLTFIPRVRPQDQKENGIVKFLSKPNIFQEVFGLFLPCLDRMEFSASSFLAGWELLGRHVSGSFWGNNLKV
jgi:hypothetical protein